MPASSTTSTIEKNGRDALRRVRNYSSLTSAPSVISANDNALNPPHYVRRQISVGYSLTYHASGNGTPDFLKSKTLEVLFVCGCEMSHSVMAKGKGEAGINDVTKSCGRRRGPIPEGLGNLGIVVGVFPSWIGLESMAECGGLFSCPGFFEYGGVAQQQVNLDQHESAEEKALMAVSILLKESQGSFMSWGIRIRRVEEEIGVRREDHESDRWRMASASG